MSKTERAQYLRAASGEVVTRLRQYFSVEEKIREDIEDDLSFSFNLKSFTGERFMEDYVHLLTKTAAQAKFSVPVDGFWEDATAWNEKVVEVLQDPECNGVINVDIWAKSWTGIKHWHMKALELIVDEVASKYKLARILSWGQDDGGHSIIAKGGRHVEMQVYMGSFGYVDLALGKYGPDMSSDHYYAAYSEDVPE